MGWDGLLEFTDGEWRLSVRNPLDRAGAVRIRHSTAGSHLDHIPDPEKYENGVNFHCKTFSELAYTYQLKIVWMSFSKFEYIYIYIYIHN